MVQHIDPQERLFLELIYETILDAGKFHKISLDSLFYVDSNDKNIRT